MIFKKFTYSSVVLQSFPRTHCLQKAAELMEMVPPKTGWGKELAEVQVINKSWIDGLSDSQASAFCP
jgi:hypothetical protein